MKTANDAWLTNIECIHNSGVNVSPRQMDSKEIISYSSTVDMSFPVVSIIERNLSFQFMAAEALWILKGDNRVKPLSEYAPSIKKYSDDGDTFYGAYGPQLIPQFEYVIQKLIEDQYTRQAVATIWIRNPDKSLDIPCTVSVQWLIRDGKIFCIDTMRSSDLWLGWPYDIFNFSIITAWICLKLKEKGLTLELGSITLQAGSQHLYAKNLDGASRCVTDNRFIEYLPLRIEDFGSSEDLLGALEKLKVKSNHKNMWLSELI